MIRRRIIIAVMALPLAGVALLAALLLWPGPDVPRFADVRDRWQPSEAYLFDRYGVLLDTKRMTFDARRLDWVPLNNVSPALTEALIAGEDKRFHTHSGVDWWAVGGAAWQTLVEGKTRGASTITMQLAAFLDPALKRQGPRSIRQKLWQMRAARAIEDHWTKDQILEAYLNLLDFRGELQGVGAATELLAGKVPSGLTRAESQVLAALLPSPSADPARIAARACARSPAADCDVLGATAYDLLDRAAVRPKTPAMAPHLASALLHAPGERLRTSLDARVQRLATDALYRHISALANRNVRDGAVLVVDNDTGQVLAYVGSSGALSRAPHVDGIRAPRQAGSTLKPFLYARAFEQRFLTPASLLEDSPLNLDTASGLYIPQNYDRVFSGPVSVRTALASSLNIPAVRALVLVGVEDFRDTLNRFGYATIDQDGEFYGYSLALGSAEVTLWDQVAAYRVLARGGVLAPLTLDPDHHDHMGQRVLSPDAAFLTTHILSDRAARVSTFGLANNLNTRFWSAVKTGTSKDMRDNWTIGFSGRYTVGVWVGNFEGDSMRNVSGVTGAAPIWQEVMTALHEDGAGQPPTPPEGVVKADVSYHPAYEAPRQDWFMAGTALEMIRKVDVAGPFPAVASPANGMVVAVDPDIPSAQQRIPVRATVDDPSLILKVGDVVLGPATRTYLWPPMEGAHLAVLQQADGTVVDRASFQVRQVRVCPNP